MWKVAVEGSDSADSLPAWWDWLLLRSQGSVDLPAGHLPSQTAHLFTPTPALPTVLLLHFPGCLLLLRRGRTWFSRPRFSCKVKVDSSLQGRPPLSRRQFLSARAHFLDFHFFYLWLVNDIVPLWKWVWGPWSHNTPEVSVTERLDKGFYGYSLSNLKSCIGMRIIMVWRLEG